MEWPRDINHMIGASGVGDLFQRREVPSLVYSMFSESFEVI